MADNKTDQENYKTILAKDNWYKIDDYQPAYTDFAGDGVDKTLAQIPNLLNLEIDALLNDDR